MSTLIQAASAPVQPEGLGIFNRRRYLKTDFCLTLQDLQKIQPIEDDMTQSRVSTLGMLTPP